MRVAVIPAKLCCWYTYECQLIGIQAPHQSHWYIPSCLYTWLYPNKRYRTCTKPAPLPHAGIPVIRCTNSFPTAVVGYQTPPPPPPPPRCICSAGCDVTYFQPQWFTVQHVLTSSATPDIGITTSPHFLKRTSQNLPAFSALMASIIGCRMQAPGGEHKLHKEGRKIYSSLAASKADRME